MEKSEKRKKLEELKAFLTHLEEQEDVLGKDGTDEGFLPNHIENCNRLMELQKEAGLIPQDYEWDPKELPEDIKKLIDRG